MMMFFTVDTQFWPGAFAMFRLRTKLANLGPNANTRSMAKLKTIETLEYFGFVRANSHYFTFNDDL